MMKTVKLQKYTIWQRKNVYVKTQTLSPKHIFYYTILRWNWFSCQNGPLVLTCP